MPLTISAYARHRECAFNTVQHAIKVGRLSKSLTTDGRIRSAAEADAEWEAATYPGLGRPPKSAGPSPLVQTRTRLDAAKAELAEMQVRERRGELVEADEVELRWAAVVAGCKAQLLAIPSRLRQEDPDLSTAQVALVERLLREALTDLAVSRRAGRRASR